MPNALIPVVTILGLQLGDLLSGAIIIETIYAWPGVGRLTIQAIEWRDYSILQANVLFIVVGVPVRQSARRPDLRMAGPAHPFR